MKSAWLLLFFFENFNVVPTMCSPSQCLKSVFLVPSLGYKRSFLFFSQKRLVHHFKDRTPLKASIYFSIAFQSFHTQVTDLGKSISKLDIPNIFWLHRESSWLVIRIVVGSFSLVEYSNKSTENHSQKQMCNSTLMNTVLSISRATKWQKLVSLHRSTFTSQVKPKTGVYFR